MEAHRHAVLCRVMARPGPSIDFDLGSDLAAGHLRFGMVGSCLPLLACPIPPYHHCNLAPLRSHILAVGHAMSRDGHAKRDVRCGAHSYRSTTSVTSEVIPVRPLPAF